MTAAEWYARLHNSPRRIRVRMPRFVQDEMGEMHEVLECWTEEGALSCVCRLKCGKIGWGPLYPHRLVKAINADGTEEPFEEVAPRNCSNNCAPGKQEYERNKIWLEKQVARLGLPSSQGIALVLEKQERE